MTTQINSEFSKILEKVASVLDITPRQHEIAVRSYQAVASFLNSEDSALKKYSPHIFPQGSFRIGTVIRPLLDNEEYDIDLTCKLHIDRSKITQKELKALIGDCLKKSGVYGPMLAPEKRRCWRLRYNDQFRFHLDIVPSIPDSLLYIQNLTNVLGVPYSLAQYAICITDNKTWDTDIDFPKSNPEGYALWFIQAMRIEFDRQRSKIAEQRRKRVDEVPEYDVKTPLQRVIQLLKRHRDIIYGTNCDKPVSIIITTLAAKAYRNEEDIFEALKNILNSMESYIETDFDGKRVIKNPVNPLENFADKWANNPEKERLFFEWLHRARKDFNLLEQKRGIHEISALLQSYFGNNVVNSALTQIGEETLSARKENRLFMELGTGIIVTNSSQNTLPIQDHNFHGINRS